MRPPIVDRPSSNVPSRVVPGRRIHSVHRNDLQEANSHGSTLNPNIQTLRKQTGEKKTPKPKLKPYLQRMKKQANDGHLHVLLGRDDDGEVTKEDEDGIHEADVVGHDDGRHGAVRGLAFDGDVIVAHAEQHPARYQSAAPEQEAAERVEGLEERVLHADERDLDAHPAEHHERHHPPQAQAEQRDEQDGLDHLVERPFGGLVEGVHLRASADCGR